MKNSVYLQCYQCFQRDRNIVLCNSEHVNMIFAKNNIRLTTYQPSFTHVTYLRDHPEVRTRRVKPFRLFCNECQTQLGVMMEIKKMDHLIPFFRSSAVCFVHDNNIIPMCDWKSAYAECNPQIPKLTKKGFDGFADISGEKWKKMPLQTFTPSRDAETGPSPYKWVIGRIAVEGYGDGNGTKEILAGAQMVPEKFRDPRKIKNPFSLLANEPVNFA